MQTTQRDQHEGRCQLVRDHHRHVRGRRAGKLNKVCCEKYTPSDDNAQVVTNQTLAV